jgi:hypothetical protein
MKQQIFVDNIHEYDYDVIDDDIHALYFQGGQWNSHLLGTVAMAIKDDGNDLKVKFDENGRIDYAEAERLFILLKLINQPAKYEIATKKLL